MKLAAVGGSRCDVRERGAVADVEVGVLLRRRGVERGGSAGPLSGNAGGEARDCLKAAEVVWKGSCMWLRVGTWPMDPYDSDLASLGSQAKIGGGGCSGTGLS